MKESDNIIETVDKDSTKIWQEDFYIKIKKKKNGK
jgi:hypothetical protein